MAEWRGPPIAQRKGEVTMTPPETEAEARKQRAERIRGDLRHMIERRVEQRAPIERIKDG